MQEKIKNNGKELHIVRNCDLDNLELLKSEKYDADYAHERYEYKRFLDGLFTSWQYYYNKFKEAEEKDYYCFNTYRYDEVLPYILNFLNSYNLGQIKDNDTITSKDGRKKITISFNCTTKKLLTSIYQELQMLEYYNKSTENVKKEYQEFLDRDKDRYAKLISYDTLKYIYCLGFISKKNLDMIPANILFRVVNLIEKNNLFIIEDLNNIDIEKYIKELLNIGLTPDMIRFITNFEDENIVNKVLEQGKSR